MTIKHSWNLTKQVIAHKINRITRMTKRKSKATGKDFKRPLASGLTLIELAIVILVLGIIMAIVYTGINPGSVIDKARVLRVKSVAQQLRVQMQLYESKYPRIPLQSDLTILTQDQDGWVGMREDDVLDPWNKPYFICADEKGKRQICTYGEDGQAGGENENQDFYLTNEKSWPQWLTEKVN